MGRGVKRVVRILRDDCPDSRHILEHGERGAAAVPVRRLITAPRVLFTLLAK